MSTRKMFKKLVKDMMEPESEKYKPAVRDLQPQYNPQDTQVSR